MSNRPVAISECKHLGRIAQEFKVDPRAFGNLSAGQVREVSKHAKDMKLQAEFAKQALAALNEIAKYKGQIEEYRKEAIELGYKTLEQIDKHILACIMRDAKHDNHLKNLLQDKFQGLNLVEAKGRSDRDVSRTEFQLKLQELRHSHNEAMARVQGSHRETMQGFQQRKAAARQQRGLMSFIRADDYAPSGRQRPALGGGIKGWFS